MSLISELRRRNVLKTAAGYFAGSWLLLQIVETLLPAFGVGGVGLRYVLIVLGIAFIPVLAISWAFEWTPDGMRRESEHAPSTGAVKSDSKTWDRIILVVMALALGLFAFDRFILSPQRDAALIETATEAGAEMERSKASAIAYESVAVLPFVNMSDDPANGYFSDGLTETLLHMLAQVDDLKVAARTSAFAFKDKNVDIRLIAAKLGVAHVLEGSVQRSSDRVRITAQLIRADDGYHVWSQIYDRTLDDIFAIQDEIAARVADALGSTLLTGNDSAIAGLFTEDVDAYDIFLKALEQEAVGTHDALSNAEALLTQALVQDPSFVDAKLGLVRNTFLKFYTGTGEFDANSVAAAQLLSEVLEENPNNLSARQFDLRLSSLVANREMDLSTYHEFMGELLLTFQEGYGNPFVRADVASYLGRESRPDEALQLLQEGLVTDPLNAPLLMAQGELQWRTVGPDAAELPFKTALTLLPDHPRILWALVRLEFARKDIVAGMRYLRKVEIVDPLDPSPTGELAVTFNELGHFDLAERWYEEYQSRNPDPAAAIDFAVQMAAERNDEATLRRIVPGAIAGRFDSYPDVGIADVLLNEYAVIMLKDGKAREGLDYLESQIPGISRLGSDAVTGWTELSIQLLVVEPLIQSLSDEATKRENTESLLALLQKLGVTPEDGQPGFVRSQNALHGHAAGKAAFLSIYTTDMYILSSSWHHFKRAPWAAELRADPEVAAVMVAREDRIAEVREHVLELIQEPEWQE